MEKKKFTEKMETLYNITRKYVEIARLVEEAKTDKLYEELKRTVEEWMKSIDVTGILELAIGPEKYVDDVVAIFNFTEKKFDIELKGMYGDYVWFGFIYRKLAPTWVVPLVKTALFFINIDKIVDGLERKLEWSLLDANQVLNKILELLGKTGAFEKAAKMIAEKIKEKMEDGR